MAISDFGEIVLANVLKWCIMELQVVKVDESGENLDKLWITQTNVHRGIQSQLG